MSFNDSWDKKYGVQEATKSKVDPKNKSFNASWDAKYGAPTEAPKVSVKETDIPNNIFHQRNIYSQGQAPTKPSNASRFAEANVNNQPESKVSIYGKSIVSDIYEGGKTLIKQTAKDLLPQGIKDIIKAKEVNDQFKSQQAVYDKKNNKNLEFEISDKTIKEQAAKRTKATDEYGFGLQGVKGHVQEGYKGTARGASNLVTGFTKNLLTWYGDSLKQNSGIRKSLVDFENEKNKEQGLPTKEYENSPYDNMTSAIGDLVKQASGKMEEAEKYINNETVLAEAPYLEGKSYMDSSLKLISKVGEGSPSVGLSAGISAITGTAKPAMILFGAIDGLSTYVNLREHGESFEKSSWIGLGNAATTALLEKLSLDSIISGKFSKAFIAEGLEEASQELATNLWNILGGDETRKWYDGIIESGIIGAITGGVTAGVFNLPSFQQNAYLDKKLREAGMSQSEIDSLKVDIQSKMAENTDVIEQVLQDKLKNPVDPKDVEAADKMFSKPVSKLQKIKDAFEKTFSGMNIYDVNIKKEFGQITPEEFKSAKKYYDATLKDALEGELGGRLEAERESNAIRKENLNPQVIEGLKNTVNYRKEGDVADYMGEGMLMQNPKSGRIIIANIVKKNNGLTEADEYRNKGYIEQGGIDSIAEAEGYDNGFDYIKAQIELSQLETKKNLKTLVTEALLEQESFAKAVSIIDEVKAYDSKTKAVFKQKTKTKPDAKFVTPLRKEAPKTKTKIQKQIEKATQTPKSDFVTTKKRETTILKEKLRNIAKIAKTKADVYYRGVKKANMTAEKITEIKRKNDLAKLKQRMKDRTAFTKRGEKTGSINQKKETKQVQKEIRQALKESELTPKDREKFSDMLKNVQTREQLERKMPEIEERIEKLETKEARRTLRKKIETELKSTKIKKENGKPVGKFTSELQKIFDLLNSSLKLSSEEASAKIIENIKEANGSPTAEIALENKILSMIDKDSSIEDLESALKMIQDMKATGKTTRELRKFNVESEYIALRDTVIEVVTDGKGIDKKFTTFGEAKATFKELKHTLKSLGKKWVFSWDGLMEALEFNSSVNDTKLQTLFNLSKENNNYKQSHYNYNESFMEAISTAYGIENKETKIHKKLGDLSEQMNLGKVTDSEGNVNELLITRDEAIKVWMELQDPTLHESFIEGNNFTEEIISTIEMSLTDGDKAFAEEQFKMYKEQWEKINPVYSEIYGVNLPFNEFYSPIRRKGFQVDELAGLGEFIGDTTDRLAITSGSFKGRTKNLLPIMRRSSIKALESHIIETNYFIAWASKVRELRSVFGNKTVTEAITQEFGSSMTNAIKNTVDDLTTSGNRHARRIAALDFFRKKATLGALMMKPSIGIKQLVSTLAYLEKVNPVDFTAGVADFWLHPIRNAKILNDESALIKTRGGNFERDIKAAMATDTFGKFSKKHNFINTAMMAIRLGDKGAIMMGSWAMRKKMLKQGNSKAETIAAYEKFSANTQQSADLSQLSQVQRGGSFEQLFTMFKSSQRQYWAKELHAIKSLFRKDGFTSKNVGKVAKTIAIYHILLPVVFQYVVNLGGWDEEDKKEYKRAAIVGSANGIFMVGDVIESVVRQALGLRVWSNEIPIYTVVNDVLKAIKKIDFDDITSEDVMEAIMEFTDAGNALAIPVKQVKNMYDGVIDIKNGNIKAGIAELAGWSSYAAGGDKSLSKNELTYKNMMKLSEGKRINYFNQLEKPQQKQMEYLIYENKYDLPQILRNLRGQGVDKKAKMINKYFEDKSSKEKAKLMIQLEDAGILTSRVEEKMFE